jgi:hypothetical protein
MNTRKARVPAIADYRSQLIDLLGQAGVKTTAPLDPHGIGDKTFLQWCTWLSSEGMQVDGKLFSLAERPALLPVYAAIPSTREEAQGLTITIMKGAQIGLTVWEVLAVIYMALKFGPLTVGMYLPDMPTAKYKSERRFMRVIRSAARLLAKFIDPQKIGGRKGTEGNALTRVMGESTFLFLWTSGKVSTESRPMDIVTMDEVQEMKLHQIDKVRARTGDSTIGLTLLLSTANMPGQDIDFWYQQGTQEVWHSRCAHCGAESDLSDPAGIFPDKSITYNSGQCREAPLNEYFWSCPGCGGWIPDPQVGRYIVTNPKANPKNRSFLIPRTVSPRMTARGMFEQWDRAKTGDQKKSFYNRTLGRPYIDADQLPVTMSVCEAAMRAGIEAGVIWKTRGRRTLMGIDQMGSFNVVIIKERWADGRQAVIHVEAIYSNDPFARCSDLMDLFDVAVCVVEQLPNANDARRFAAAYAGRVFLANYGRQEDMLVWGDQLNRSDRKTDEQDRSRYTVRINQYKAMQRALFRIREAECLFPDSSLLEQDVIENKERKRICILRDMVFFHFTKTALVVQQDDEERKPAAKVHKVGLDPHFIFANMLCDVAWARVHGNGAIFIPTTAVRHQQSAKASGGSIKDLLWGPTLHAVEAIAEAQELSCNRCLNFDAENSTCMERGGLRVRPEQFACPLYST